MVEAERQKRFFKVPQEVLEDSGDDVDIVHLAEHRDGLTAEKLLLQLLHLTISTRQTVQTGLKGENSFTFTDFDCASQCVLVRAGKPSPHAGPFFLSRLYSGPQGQESWVLSWRRSLPIHPAHREVIIIPCVARGNNIMSDNISAHLSDFDRCGNGIGDARQGATLPTLGVRDHPALPTLQ